MKKSPKTRILLLGVSSLCMLTIPQFAFANTSTSNAELFPLTPRVSGLGLAGTDEVVAGDAMAALAGNENGIWWLDGQGKTAFQTSWVGSLGTGFRVAQGDKRILGAYVFGDRNISGSNTDFWFVSPGVESLGQIFDFRVNGYIPVSNRRVLTGTGWADTFGNYDYVTFQGHQQLDQMVNNYEMTGWGLDGEAGVRVPGWHGTRVYAGGYHFDQDQASAINGVAARVEVPINANLALNVRDSYDNTQHNTIEVGLQMNLGGVNKHPRDPDQPIRERLLDPVSRNLATLGQGTAEPIGNEQTLINNNGPTPPPPQVERDNIWFFSSTGTDTFTGNIEDCTATSVCASTDFTQATVNGINDFVAANTSQIDTTQLSTSPSFYLASNTTYSALNSDGTGPMEFTNDWIFGKTPDFVQPAQTTLIGAMEFNGDLNKVNNIILQSDGIQDIGIILNPGSNLSIEHSDIGSNILGLNYHTAIQMTDATLTVTDTDGGPSNIVAYGNDGNPVTGIDAVYTGTSGSLVINNSTVTATTESEGAPVSQSATAISLTNAPSVTITNNSVITASATFVGDQTSASDSTMATGIFTNGSTININNSDVTADAEVTGNNTGSNLAAGIGASSVGGSGLTFQDNNITITGFNTDISASAITGGSNIGTNAVVGIGINAVGTSGTALFTNNVITLTGGSQINDLAQVQDTTSTANMAAGIGANADQADNAMVTGNTINLTNTDIVSEVDASTNSNVNFAVGIGSNVTNGSNADFTGNTIALTNSQVAGNADVITNSVNFNFGAGIGSNATNGSSASFTDNTITLANNSSADGTATISGGTFTGGQNFATGLGGNTYNGSDTSFTDNTITLTNNSSANGTAITQSLTIINFNSAAGIGGNTANGGDVTFDNNTIQLTNSSANGTANILGNNSNLNFATGIGGNGDASGIAVFDNNTIQLTNSSANGTASVEGNNGGLNFAAGIGGNSELFAINTFNDNTIELADQSSANGIADVNGSNSFLNFATGIGGNAYFLGTADFNDNTIELTNQSSATGLVDINIDNLGLNFATGLGGNTFDSSDASFTGNSINLSDSDLTATANVKGLNNVINSAIGLGGNAYSSTANFSNNTLIQLTDGSSASGVTNVGTNAVLNVAIGIGGFAAGGGSANFNNNTSINLDNSTASGSSNVATNTNINLAIGLGGSGTAAGGSADFIGNTSMVVDNGSKLEAIAFADNNSGNNLAFGLDFEPGSTGSITITNSDVIAETNYTVNSGVNIPIGLFADNAVTGTMTGGSISALENGAPTGQCEVSNINIAGVPLMDRNCI